MRLQFGGYRLEGFNDYARRNGDKSMRCTGVSRQWRQLAAFLEEEPDTIPKSEPTLPIRREKHKRTSHSVSTSRLSVNGAQSRAHIVDFVSSGKGERIRFH